MKKILYIFFLLSCFSISLHAQITVDSIFVYQTSGTDSTITITDSIYIGGTHTGQVLKQIQVIGVALNGSVVVILNFQGCDSVNVTSYDTTIVYGYHAASMGVFSKWDTTADCSYPTEPIYTDTLFWNTVSTNRIIDENQVKVYPNPASEVLKIEYSEGIRPRRIQLISLNGKIVKTFEPFEEILDVQMLTTGLYILRIEMENGQYIRKRVMIQ